MDSYKKLKMRLVAAFVLIAFMGVLGTSAFIKQANSKNEVGAKIETILNS